MAFRIQDEEIDLKLKEVVRNIENQFGIKNVSKTDALRFLLKIRKQGKKTNRKWKNIIL